jgi:threonine synthase
MKCPGVCPLTGHGLKDPENAIRIAEKPMTVPAKLDSVLKAMGLVPA